ncbi:hypothetical protein PJ311_18995 [Bacillus sp. CLL-7-23]|uniref:Uncharacterized protein n=1 Tax=Bacillus changyiensis TaxID=3004103 RepID=A0ABT4X8J6_9BACI|nr:MULTISPECIES: hypothetical protein [Bacillus]MDA7028622.1 hypothetical protein [Bacillus changyiensis]NPC91209.1 hypothetical protein [Bacillus sp. WMMC1349]
MKKSMKVVFAVVMSLVLLVPTINSFAAEQNNEQNNDVSKATVALATLSQENTTFCSSSTTEDSNQKIGIQRIPGDYNNSCKIVKTEKRDNVTYTNWENQIISAIAGGGLGLIGNYIAKGPLKAFLWGAGGAVWAKIPENKPVYVTIQHRECKDYFGYHQYLIIKSYKDKKRTKFISIEMKKLS